MRLLTADIGGTNSRFAEFCAQGNGDLELCRSLTVPTAAVGSFAELMGRVREAWGPLSDFRAAALAVPGPVTQARSCFLPNVAWNRVELDSVPDLPPTVLLNDFAAQGWACLHPEAQNLQRVAGPDVPLPDARAARTCTLTRGVLGPGTGLGLCAVLPMAKHERSPGIVTSEGGHALFPFLPAGAPGAGPDEMAFAQWLQQRAGCTAVELVVAGRGLTHLHAFYTGEDKEPAEVAAHMEQTPVLEAYARYLGRTCQQWILYTTCAGGLYIAGGIAAANPAVLTHPAFAQGLYAVQKHDELLARTPIWLVRNTRSALWGAAAAAGALG